MSLKEQLKEEISAERRKMKEMSFRDKLWYIWEYYKLHIGAVILAIVLLNIVATSVYNTTIHPGLYCIIINSQSAQEMDMSILEEDFHDLMGFGKKQPVYAESMFITHGDAATEYSYASMAKISALVASRDLDVLMGDKENIEHYASMDGLADLTQILPGDILSQVEDRFVYAADSAGQSLPVSIDLSGTDFVRNIHLSEDASNLSIISNSIHKDNNSKVRKHSLLANLRENRMF